MDKKREQIVEMLKSLEQIKFEEVNTTEFEEHLDKAEFNYIVQTMSFFSKWNRMYIYADECEEDLVGYIDYKFREILVDEEEEEYDTEITVEHIHIFEE